MGKNVRLVSTDNGESFEPEEQVGFWKKLGQGIWTHKKKVAVGVVLGVLAGVGLTLLGRKGSQYGELEAGTDEDDYIEEGNDEEVNEEE